MRAFILTVAAALIASFALAARSAEPVKLAAKFTMPAGVQGRFDHLGVDLHGRRLFLTAETAHEVLVFNIDTGKFVRAITGIEIPHAIFYRADLDRLFITDGGAGEVKEFNGTTYQLTGAAKLKVDSDSIGYDPATHYLYIDNGGGDAHETFSMLSVVDTTSGRKVADIKIDGDTLEAMALAPSSARLYVNNPAKNEVDVVDREARKLVAAWPVTLGKRNVAMALDEAAHRLFVACRSGALVVFNTENGKELQSLPIAKGVDDLIFDFAQKRLYAACAAGELDVFQEKDPDHYASLGQIATAPGAKNEVLVESLHRLYTTVPPHAGAPGQVYVYDVQ
jgi:DNA-binding beta-propeller fold protein YncE